MSLKPNSGRIFVCWLGEIMDRFGPTPLASVLDLNEVFVPNLLNYLKNCDV